MTRVILSSILILGCFIPSFSQEAIPSFTFGKEAEAETNCLLSGKILEAGTEIPLIGALILVDNTTFNTITDQDGLYNLALPPGKYIINISSLGFSDYQAEVNIYRTAEWDVILESTSVELAEVTVRDRKVSDNVTSVLTGAEHLSIAQIERQSKFLGETDVLRSLQSVTGVTSVGEGSSGFNVRGGNADENLIFMDNNLLFNPVHALGFFSLFHPDMVEGATLYKGGVPARYGGRMSSVLDVNLRDGNNEQLSIRGGLGLTSARMVIEGPISPGKASFIVGGRYSNFDWLLNQTNNLDLINSRANFGDLTAKVDARLSNTTRIGFTAFTTNDLFQFAEEVRFDYQTSSGSAYIKHLIGEKINITGFYNKGRYTSNLYDITGNDQSQFQNFIDYDRVGINGYYQYSPNTNFQVGAEHQVYHLSPGTLFPSPSSILAPLSIAREKGAETSLYANLQTAFSDKFELMAGLRFTQFRNIGPENVLLYDPDSPRSDGTIVDSLIFQVGNTIASYSGFEPRLSLRYSLSSNRSVKLGYNRSYQFISQISNTASATPVDVWQLSNYHLQPQNSDNFSLGYFQNFRENTIQTYAVIFYRKISNLLEYKDFAQILLNDNIETELVTGEGRSYGFELLYHKNYGKHRLETNYTFSRSQRKILPSATQAAINNGEWYSSNFDKPHSFNLNYLYQINQKNSLSINFTYSTGRPTTAPVSSFAVSNILTIPVYSERNQFRIPDYHRMDIAYTIGPWGKKKRWRNSLTLSIYNIYFRKNAYSVFFRQRPFQRVTTFRVAVLGTAFPAITYNFTW